MNKDLSDAVAAFKPKKPERVAEFAKAALPAIIAKQLGWEPLDSDAAIKIAGSAFQIGVAMEVMYEEYAKECKQQ